MQKYTLLIILGLCGNFSAVRAQIGNQPDWGPEITVIKAQPLVVLLDEEDAKELRQLANKPDELAQYKAYVAQHNAQLRQLAPQLWRFSPKVEFRMAADYEELRKERQGQTVVLHYTQQRLGEGTPTIPSLNTAQVAWMQLEIVGKGDKDVVWQGPLPWGAMYPSDIVFTFRNLQRDLQTKAEDAGKNVTNRQGMARMLLQDMRNGQRIRTKTLLVNQAELADHLQETDIAKVYPFAFRLVPSQVIEAAVQAGDTSYLYVRQLTVRAGLVGPSIIDAADGQRIVTSPSKGGLSKADFVNFTQHLKLIDRYAKNAAKLEDAAR